MSKYVGLYMDRETADMYKMNNQKDFLLNRPLKAEVIEDGVIFLSKSDFGYIKIQTNLYR